MSKNRLIVIAVIVVLLALVLWRWRRAGPQTVAIDLVEQFSTAEKRSNLPLHQAFDVTEVSIDGETKRSIFAHPTSRIIWKVTLPDEAWLKLALALKPDAWDRSTDGVLFRVGVSDGRGYEEYLNQHVDPKGSTSDRRWIPVTIDLSAYGGRQVDLIFNTNSSLPGRGDDPTYDWGLWGAPAVFAAE